MPLFKIFCLLQLSSLVSSIVWNEPTQTAWRAEPVGNFVEQTAAPAAPALRRRDDPQGSICGYFPGELNGAFTCGSSAFCGYDQVNTMFGCCTYDAAENSYLGCGQQSTCYQTTPTSSDTGALFCTDAASPSCVKYLYSFPAVVYSAFGCSDVPGTFEVYSTFVASAPKSLAYTATTESGGTILLTSSNGSPITDSQSQSTNVVSIAIAPTATQKTAGSQATSNILPTTTKSGTAEGRHPRRWRVAISCGFLGVLLVV
ncbi:hypothetical protein L207DRAFT_520245 [Hyaloscypha variabilis F]|uniref:Uncharacterized protein n=1 Tax=Hyaloscypha variabilis (strain UAMH 11265 / GT02V1 / F) TaxID=1149755 RepID=A0A2J6QVZ4_HYAVF|nr:hypothetical protein L207DRAFT_520245 [Hyaloscypha variabilis F]